MRITLIGCRSESFQSEPRFVFCVRACVRTCLYPSGRGFEKSILAEGSLVPDDKAEPKESDDRPGGIRRERSFERKMPSGWNIDLRRMRFDRLKFQKTDDVVDE